MLLCLLYLEETNFDRRRTTLAPIHFTDGKTLSTEAEGQKLGERGDPVASIKAPPRQKSWLARRALVSRRSHQLVRGTLWRGVRQPIQLLCLPLTWYVALQYGIYQVGSAISASSVVITPD